MSSSFEFQPLWLGLGLVFHAERIISAWRGGLKYRVISAMLVIEFIFDLFIGAVYVTAIWQGLRGKRLSWGIETIDQEVAHV